MKRLIISGIVIVLIIIGGFLALKNYNRSVKQGQVSGPAITKTSEAYSDLGYVYFGNEAKGDLNADGIDDATFLITQDNGGSGTFYYVGVALKTSSGYQRTNPIFLGDRIAPQTTEIRNGIIIINYAERKPGEPMTARPSVGVSKYFLIDNGILTPTETLGTN